MPMGDNMGYYQMIISNTTGEKMRIDKVVEVDANGVEKDNVITSKCNVDEKGYGLLIPAQKQHLLCQGGGQHALQQAAVCET